MNLEIYEVADNIKARLAKELWGDLYDAMEWEKCSDDPEVVVYEVYRQITDWNSVVVWKADDPKTVVKKITKIKATKIVTGSSKLTQSGKAVVGILAKKVRSLSDDEVVHRYSVLELLTRIRSYEHPNIGTQGFCISSTTPKSVIDEKCKKYFGMTYKEMEVKGHENKS